MIVKMEIDLESSFVPWKEMFIDNEYKLNKHRVKLVFAEDKNTCPLDHPFNIMYFPQDIDLMSKIKNWTGV